MTEVTGQQSLWVSKLVFLQLVFSIESLIAHVTVKGPLVNHAVLYEIRPCCKLLITHITRIGSVAKVQILMFHENVLVAKPALADVTLVRFFAHMGKPDVTDQTILVTKLLLAQGAMEGATFTACLCDGLYVLCSQVTVRIVIVCPLCR